ncbi:helix-turn-helix domain-containing protein [Actinacidiphila yeochonensis]|uniref:helix-turn-helix domain-containing protein n=1 Tax=Actinacidiphila yeochonensis TaxID=89050 RepID=UPI000B0C9A5D|nr:helix-turn-helix transcriptional regulator [Actinacidiphila yeochonensis]
MVTDASTGSTVPRRQLGRQLRDLRQQAGLTLKAAAATLEFSETKMWRIETGQTVMRTLDVEQMCRIYGAPEDATKYLMSIAKQTRDKAWWFSYGDVIVLGFDLYLGLEEAAARLSWYEANLVPGLLQTRNYARTLIREDNPDLSFIEIERRVDLRVARQRLLRRSFNAPDLHVVLDEAIMHRPVGSTEVMVEQLKLLLKLGDLPNVSLRVVRYAAGVHRGLLSGPFVLLDFPLNVNGQPSEPSTVYVDGFAGSLYLDRPHEVERYSSAFTKLWDEAENEKDSATIIYQTAKGLEN